jgi:integrase
VQFAAERKGATALGDSRSTPSFKGPSNPDMLLSEAFGEFHESIIESSKESKERQNSLNATRGKHEKHYYIAKNLGEALHDLPPILSRDLDIKHAKLLAEQMKRRVSGENNAKWSRQKLDDVLRMLRRFANWALARNQLTPSGSAALKDTSVFASAKRAAALDKSRRDSQQVSKEQLAKLRAALSDDPMWQLVVDVQYLTGARASEVLGLHKSQIVKDEADILEFSVPHKCGHLDGSRE